MLPEVPVYCKDAPKLEEKTSDLCAKPALTLPDQAVHQPFQDLHEYK